MKNGGYKMMEAIKKFYEERDIQVLKKKLMSLLEAMNGEMEEVTRNGETTLTIYLDDRKEHEIAGDWDNDLDRLKAGIEYLELVRLEDLEILEDELARA